MGREIVLMSSEERKDVASVAQFVSAFSDQLRNKQIVLRRGEDELRFELPDQVVLEIKAEEEMKGERKKLSVEIEIEWYEGESSGITLG